jgi:hypothetical protein
MRINNTLIGYAVDYLQKLNVDVPRIVLFSVVLTKLSQLACHCRAKVKTEGIADKNGTFPNIYTLTFMSSGGGKDKPYRDFDRTVIPWFKEEFVTKATKFKEKILQEIQKEADEKYGESNTAVKANFIESKTPHFLIRELKDGTAEGLTAMRESFEMADFGCTFLKISEFGDFITSDNSLRESLLSYIVEIYDFGDSAGKVTKGNKFSRSVEGVPSVASFHTSISGLLEGRNHDKLITFLDRGGARRFLTAYVDGSEESYINRSLSVEEQANFVKKEKVYATELLEGGLFDSIKEFFDILSKKYTAVDNVYVFDEETENHLGIYTRKCVEESGKVNEQGISIEIHNRPFKAIKLAGLVAMWSDPENKKVTLSDLEMAIEVLEFYGESYKKFYSAKPDTDFDKIANFLIKNVNKFYKKDELIKKIGLQRNDLFKIWKFNYADLEDYAIDKGFEFIEKDDVTSTSRKKPKIYGFSDNDTETKIREYVKKIEKLNDEDASKLFNQMFPDGVTDEELRMKVKIQNEINNKNNYV